MSRTAIHPALPALSANDEALFGAFRRALLTDLGPDFQLGFKLAYFYNFASPQVARQLLDSGRIRAQPMRRAKDTSIVVYEILANGFESDRGRRMLDLLRRVHEGVAGSRDDYLYVLTTLFVVPVRLVDRSGRRPLSARERAEAAAFFARLGEALDLAHPPQTYTEATAFSARYEAEFARPSAAGAELMELTLGALLDRLPGAKLGVVRRVSRGLARVGVSALIADPVISRAVGLPVVSRGLGSCVLALRRASRRGARPDPVAFASGETSSVYPAGYALDDIGPDAPWSPR